MVCNIIISALKPSTVHCTVSADLCAGAVHVIASGFVAQIGERSFGTVGVCQPSDTIIAKPGRA